MNPNKKKLGPWFWVILFTPVILVLATLQTAVNSNGPAIVFVGLAVVAAALYCGFRLSYFWLGDQIAAGFVGLVLSFGILAVYAAVFFFGCLAAVGMNL